MTGGSILVLGGTRSGKSRYAEEIARSSNLDKVYVATAQALDDEMRDRIAAHKARRDGSWTNIDAQLDIVGCLKDQTGEGTVVLVDCLTMWLSNHLLYNSDVEMESRRLADNVTTLAGLKIFVSNEVGSGIVPDNALGRQFRDAQGRLNQMMAETCDTVTLVVAGLPMLLKGKQLI